MDTIINVTAANIITGLAVSVACVIAGWFGYKAGKAATEERTPDTMSEDFHAGFIAGEKAARKRLQHSYRKEHRDA